MTERGCLTCFEFLTSASRDPRVVVNYDFKVFPLSARFSYIETITTVILHERAAWLRPSNF